MGVKAFAALIGCLVDSVNLSKIITFSSISLIFYELLIYKKKIGFEIFKIYSTLAIVSYYSVEYFAAYMYSSIESTPDDICELFTSASEIVLRKIYVFVKDLCLL